MRSPLRAPRREVADCTPIVPSAFFRTECAVLVRFSRGWANRRHRLAAETRREAERRAVGYLRLSDDIGEFSR